MTASDRFDPTETRAKLIKRGIKPDSIVQYAYRPFDIRWIYREPETKLLDEKRTEYWPHVAANNLFLSAGERNRKQDFYQPQVTNCLSDHHLVESNVGMFPQFLLHGEDRILNLARPISEFATSHGLPPDRIFHHVVAILQAPSYRSENSGALRMDWPRVPLPNNSEQLAVSADLGDALAGLLNPGMRTLGISKGTPRSGMHLLGLPMKKGGTSLETADLTVTAGWGYFQIDNKTGTRKTMAGQGLAFERDYSPLERSALEAEAQLQGITLNELMTLIGVRTFDVYFNTDSYWSNVPEKVWAYTLGRYQVIKKWLSYREQGVLGRPLKPDEVAYVAEMVRRIAAILIMGPALDDNYRACAVDAQTYEALGLSRDAVRERKGAKTLKQGASNRHTPATKQNREAEKARGKRGKKPAPA
jgi:hypothetical protein